MDPYVRDRVATIAADVRNKIQSKADNSEQYTHGDETVSSLCGWCAIAAATLFDALKRGGISATIQMWVAESKEAHVYVEVEDHVVDITATQYREFSSQEVVILHSREAEVYPFYNPTYSFTSPESLRKHQQKTKWPHDQIAYVC